mmetsp:Transcript_38994/g.51421  ORF Transcript_38994/g.51421 Transcript_38994/m.51421 type:complete len:94 (+) Transcript_38994:54-335(+)
MKSWEKSQIHMHSSKIYIKGNSKCNPVKITAKMQKIKCLNEINLMIVSLPYRPICLTLPYNIGYLGFNILQTMYGPSSEATRCVMFWMLYSFL